MPLSILAVRSNSAFYKQNIRNGYILISVNGQLINDELDLTFYTKENRINHFTFITANKEYIAVNIRITADSVLQTLTFEQKDLRACINHCVFCFVDQMAPGLRLRFTSKMMMPKCLLLRAISLP